MNDVKAAAPEYAFGDRDAYRVFAAALFGKPVEAIQLHERLHAKTLALHYGYSGGSRVDGVTPGMERITRLFGPDATSADWAPVTNLHAAVLAAPVRTREAAATIAHQACLVPPDGGSPTEAETEMCDRAAAAIRALPLPGDTARDIYADAVAEMLALPPHKGPRQIGMVAALACGYGGLRASAVVVDDSISDIAAAETES